MAESVSSAVSRRRFLYAVAVAAAPIAFLARVKTSSGQGQGTVELDPTPAAGEKKGDRYQTPYSISGMQMPTASTTSMDFDAEATSFPVPMASMR